jgi:phosphatidylinositol alpha-1,6-mannosyltransferase
MTTLVLGAQFSTAVGGAGRWLSELYARLPREQFVLMDSKVMQSPHDLQTLRAVQRTISERRITRVHCGRSLPEGWAALAVKLWRGVPYACHVHGEEVNLVSGAGRGGLMSSRRFRLMTRAVLAGARGLLANSHNTADILRTQWHVPAERVHVLHPGVDTERFTPAPAHTEIRQLLGWSNRSVVLTVARLQERKGHAVMIEALTQVRTVVPDVLYAIVGAGEERKRLESLVAESGLGGHVQFLGEVSDDTLVQCYQQCDLFVLPNRRVGRDIEGFGMALVEAQACGKPVVAGCSGGTAETMRVPETGWLVPCNTPAVLATAVSRLLCARGARARMGTAARTWAVEQFDWTHLVERAGRLFATELAW